MIKALTKKLGDISFRLQSISLLWKLLIPFLMFAFVGTTTLAYIGLSSQRDLIMKEERKEVEAYYRHFLGEMEHKKDQALSLATIIAEDPQVRQLLGGRHRKALFKRMRPLYARLKDTFGVQVLHFHTPPGQSFLRVHWEDQYGEMISYRRAVMEAMKTEKGVTGLEWGFAGLGIRGVVPIDHQGALAGSIEIGFPFGQTFLDHLKGHWGPDFAVYEMPDRERFVLIAATRKGQEIPDPRDYLAGPVGREPVIKIAPPKNPQRSVLLGPIRDYYGDLVALVVIDMDRSAIEARLMKTTRLMILVGAAGVLVSFVLTWLVAMFFIKPIKEIVKEAREIAEGKRERHLATRPSDEIGILTQALNRMLDALRERRLKIEEYARTLERRVEERTTDLITSEEKFRSLVENLPLIVYRLQNDGTTEFINPCFTEKLGYTAEEVVGDRTFWKRHICGAREEEGTILETCWGRGDMYRIERAVRSKDGRVLIFIDHAIPLTNAHGNVRWIDGTMVDITELKELQESAVRTEEMRILGEISARLAHEIRNPLVTAGGFARRLRDKLPEGDPHQRIADIIVEEVSRLEQILRAILSSIRPLTLSLGPVDVAAMLRLRVAALSERMRENEIELDATLASGIPTIVADETLLDRAFESILKHAVISMPRGARLGLDLRTENDHILFMVRHRSDAMTDEDLEQFFFPHFIGGADADLLDLPLSRIIIHRHGGKVDVFREEKEIIVLQIELPLRPPEASSVH